jgi:hypothetical protein
MAYRCNVCGSLIMAQNEVLGYGGPLCSGHHAEGSQNSGEVRANDKPLRKLAPVSPNTNIDDIFEEFEKDYQESSGSMAFAKASIKAKTQLEALLSAAKIQELRRLWPSFTVDGYFTVDGETIKERIKELEKKQ